MGNTFALPHRDSDGGGTGKVILADGSIHEYDKPLTAAELMLEYPQHMVMEFFPINMNGTGTGSGNVRKKPAPLPADKMLEMNKVYLMIPMRRGKPGALSYDEARSILLRANSFLKSKPLLVSSSSLGQGCFLPSLARIRGAGIGGKRHQDHPQVVETQLSRNKFQRQLIVEEEEEQQQETTKTADCYSEMLMAERPEFMTLSGQFSGKGWKPSLDTITEKAVHTKVRHWLFS